MGGGVVVELLISEITGSSILAYPVLPHKNKLMLIFITYHLSSEYHGSNQICAWCDGSLDRSLMVDPLSYFFSSHFSTTGLTNGCGMYYPVYEMVHIKEPLLLTEKSTPCSGSSRFLFAECRVILYIRCHTSVT